jgi:hypothetical protein
MAMTTLRIELPVSRPLATIVVSTEDEEALRSIVSMAAMEHGLDLASSEEPDVLVTYGKRWDHNGEGHARTITVTAKKDGERPGTFEVSVFEWLAWGHSALGRDLIQELKDRLRRRFGPEAVR